MEKSVCYVVYFDWSKASHSLKQEVSELMSRDTDMHTLLKSIGIPLSEFLLLDIFADLGVGETGSLVQQCKDLSLQYRKENSKLKEQVNKSILTYRNNMAPLNPEKSKLAVQRLFIMETNKFFFPEKEIKRGVIDLSERASTIASLADLNRIYLINLIKSSPSILDLLCRMKSVSIDSKEKNDVLKAVGDSLFSLWNAHNSREVDNAMAEVKKYFNGPTNRGNSL